MQGEKGRKRMLVNNVTLFDAAVPFLGRWILFVGIVSQQSETN